MLNIVQNSSRILLFLVNDLLDFFMLKNQKFKVDYQLNKPIDGIKDLMDMFAESANEKNIELSLKVAPDIPNKLIFDEQRMH